MMAPAAMFIDSAEVTLPKVSGAIRDSQISELLMSRPNASNDFKAGYELGLQVARTCLQLGVKFS